MFHRVLACITLCIFANYTSLPQLLGQKGKPSHHTKGGFKNNYLPKEQMSKNLSRDGLQVAIFPGALRKP